MMKSALYGSLHSQNPFGSAGVTTVDLIIAKQARKRRSTGAAVATVHVKYSSQTGAPILLNNGNLAGSVVKSVQTALSVPSFASMIDQQKLVQLQPIITYSEPTSTTTTTTTTK